MYFTWFNSIYKSEGHSFGLDQHFSQIYLLHFYIPISMRKRNLSGSGCVELSLAACISLRTEIQNVSYLGSSHEICLGLALHYNQMVRHLGYYHRDRKDFYPL